MKYYIYKKAIMEQETKIGIKDRVKKFVDPVINPYSHTKGYKQEKENLKNEFVKKRDEMKTYAKNELEKNPNFGDTIEGYDFLNKFYDLSDDYINKDSILNKKIEEKNKKYQRNMAIGTGAAVVAGGLAAALIKKNKNKWNNMNCEDLTDEKEKQDCKKYKSKIKQ